MPEGDYEVCIDATLEAGSLTYGECTLPGPDENAQEVLISSHVCHPSLCNDNLSGIAVATFLAELLQTADRSKQYRFVFAPGTIGAITWLSRNENNLDNITNGLVLTCLGDPGPMTYKQSRRGDALIDRAFSHVLKHAGNTDCVRPFSPYGYDERQYNSPGFNLPVGCLMRSPCGEFPQYHTSADDLGFVTPEALADSLFVCLQALEIVEGNAICINRKPRGEPRLGKYDVDPPSPHHDPQDYKMALLWVLNLSDGEHDLLQIADRADLPFALIRDASEALLRTELLGQA
jgi:aminopeptidase-like protein